MKEQSDKRRSTASEQEVVAAFIIKTEQKKEKEFRDYIRSELGSISAGKRIVLNSK